MYLNTNTLMYFKYKYFSNEKNEFIVFPLLFILIHTLHNITAPTRFVTSIYDVTNVFDPIPSSRLDIALVEALLVDFYCKHMFIHRQVKYSRFKNN